MKVDEWLRKAARAVFAPRCLLCGESGVDGRDLCRACTEALPWNHSACATCALPLPAATAAPDRLPGRLCGACLCRPPPLAATHAAFVYGFPVDRLLPRLKFHQGLAAGRLMSQLAAEAFVTAPRPEAIVPIPLHRARLRERGYDQALELARPLARALDLPLRDDLLRRRKATAQQSRLDATARRRNLRRAFDVVPRQAMPAHVVLFDDVMTTGATLHAAASALRRAGIERVDAWVCARVP
ncbi:MAG TPA: ComF family protein [Xanthomonadaceae bacterium]|nr:ComF family protein [Xanthomonadaceae bacterium]